MKVSPITEISTEETHRRNDFIRFSNKFMSRAEGINAAEQANSANKKHAKLGIENLQEFTIFPREIIDGRTVITA